TTASSASPRPEPGLAAVEKEAMPLFREGCSPPRAEFASFGGQIPHLRTEMCFFRRTCRRKKRDCTFFAPAGANSARLFPQAESGRSFGTAAFLPECGFPLAFFEKG